MEALIIIDMQEGYIGSERGSKEFDNVLDHINYVSRLFRQNNRTVFVIRDLSEGDGPEFGNVKELLVQETDIEVTKLHHNGFWKTNLHALLQEHDIDFVVLAGNAAEYCVTATYFGALENGYQTVMLQNGVLAATVDGIRSLNQTRPLISYTAIKQLLSK